MFTSDLPELPAPRREFAAAMLGEDLVICGGWNALRAEAEYEAQASFIKELYSVHDKDSGVLQYAPVNSCVTA